MILPRNVKPVGFAAILKWSKRSSSCRLRELGTIARAVFETVRKKDLADDLPLWASANDPQTYAQFLTH